jgi:outer membrane protein OmpA-like peptidoglycan-associated protein
MLLGSVLLALAPLAQAQDEGGFNAHGITLAPQRSDVRETLTLLRPAAMTRGDLFGAGVLEYANRPLVYVVEQDGADPTTTGALDHVFALHLTGGYAPHERLRFGAALPVYATTTGVDGTAGPTLGDARLDTLFLAADPTETGIGAGAAAWLDLPTGAARRFVGRRTVAGGLGAIGTYEGERLTLTGNVGVQLEPSIDLDNLKGADQIVAGAAASWLVADRTAIGLETVLRAALASNERAWTGSPAEAIVTLRHRDESGAHVVGGIAAPLSRGAGAAAFRIFVGGGFGRTVGAGPRDRDADGIPDKVDACHLEPEVFNGYVDEDGCPDALARLDVIVRYDGAPAPDADLTITGPGVQEQHKTTDAPLTREVVPDSAWEARATRGPCLVGEGKQVVPAGNHTLVVDLVLAPAAAVRFLVTDPEGQPVPGARMLWDSPTPECLPAPPELGPDGRARADIGVGEHKVVIGAPGYRVAEVPVYASRGDDLEVIVKLQPTKLRVEKKRIVILDKVQFEFNKATIKPESFDLLNEVAEVILRNPQAGRVEIQGHTDGKGRPAYNLDLSQRRADAVRDYLIARGVAAERLISKGYGLTVPIATNDTEAGRATNRRVEFLLIDQAEQQIEEPAPAE